MEQHISASLIMKFLQQIEHIIQMPVGCSGQGHFRSSSHSCFYGSQIK